MKAQERQCVWCETAHEDQCPVERWHAEYEARRAEALQFSLPKDGSIYVSDNKGLSAPYPMDAAGNVEIQGNELQFAEQDNGWFVRCPDGDVVPVLGDRWTKPIAKDIVNPDNVGNPFLAVWLREYPDKSGNRHIKISWPE